MLGYELRKSDDAPKRPFRNPLSGVLLPPERIPDPIVFR